MSDLSVSVTAWPAARPSGINPIQHPAWEEARNAILDLVAEGPVTVVIVGEPGTGKTWLLRELASALGAYGFPTMLLMQGNLPMTLGSGSALLVDDASLMDHSTRAQMSAQEHGVVVLAGAEWFEDELDPARRNPVIIRLRPLEPGEIAGFAAEWLKRSGMADSIVGPAMLARLTSGSGGRVGTIVRLLGEQATDWQTHPILAGGDTPAETIPEVRAEEPTAGPIQPTPQRRGKRDPLLLGGTAIAAAIALGWALMPVPPPMRALRPAAPLPALAARSRDIAPVAAPLPLPPLGQADTPLPALVTASAPALPTQPVPAPAAPPPKIDAAEIAVETAIAVSPPLPVLPPAEPAVVATLDAPAARPTPVPLRQFERTGGPGLVLMAQRGDTLESLYGNVYRDRNAPPFATIVAANPGPFKPGAIVVFPEPPGGWQRVQR